ncbi:aminotransferase class V-fold PLP-dependent enzyme [Pedobacter sp. MC2016-14]|uniref:aminotransferase class V-fold PLP-dependent enzyme n=1 Tax=Pedobacter sp. MC2016-14 TaxID=2897327 RepID=UPI001E379D71|nr:aminotransferase class V-fold PLP-dependent enzyme [Pedobacter sp. MC2016-14]MCD0488205.1 aminotransferase class V-fold PLP-dependent enzyme [Pedobacter sp. MC2016-14]
MNFKALYPVLQSYTYLNTAYSGILSKPLLDWRNNHDQDFLKRGSTFRLQQQEVMQETRQNLARLFRAKASNTFLVPNFSFGFNTFLNGLEGPQRFLLLQEDYPSVNYPVQSRGYECDYVAVDHQLEENLIANIKSFKPSVLALSLVQYISGIKIDFESIKKIKSMFPDLLIVADGTQFCGTAEFNFEASGLDVLISSGYKWMLGGFGNGFVFIKDKINELLYTKAQSANMPTEPFLLNRGILSLYFEPGHQDTLSFGSLNHSILFLEKTGLSFIENQISQLSKKARKAFTERGLLDLAVTQRKSHSSIFNLSISATVAEKLQEANILFSARGNGSRVSFHFYNTEEDLNHLLEVIDKNS